MGELPTPVLAVQATRFDGGVAVGRSLWTFVKAWATACRGETPAETPCFDRSVVKLPGGEDLARSVLRKFAPNLPVTAPPAWFEEERTRFTRCTFTLGERDIQRLKQHIVHLGEANGASPLLRPPSTFPAVAALAWTCFIQCKPFASDDDVLLFFFTDVRDRLDPPIEAGYMGVCLWPCFVSLPASEVHGELALAAAASAVPEEVSKMREVPVATWSFLTSWWAGRPMDRLMNVSGSPRFRAYEDADFRWGKPKRTEPIRMNHDGQIALMGAGDGHGVQVSVSLLQPAQMDLFRSHFLDLLG
ncbi:unnamed protein product [Triticum aestivum]|uniref:Uncharacterized protein n=1 Tax=Triticum aestivum TaxID=4565 RepID=A0A7H4LPQ8_WHEAT|nr:unnamed protein product [Triticum aestivum]